MLRDSEDSESNEFDPEDSDSDDCDEEILLFLLLMRRARRRLQAAIERNGQRHGSCEEIHLVYMRISYVSYCRRPQRIQALSSCKQGRF
eukprot:gene2502-2893_t